MKKSLSKSEYVYIASMLFGMFFGAGNLIFPVYMGQMAGRNMGRPFMASSSPASVCRCSASRRSASAAAAVCLS